jgi:hypothetical protein
MRCDDAKDFDAAPAARRAAALLDELLEALQIPLDSTREEAEGVALTEHVEGSEQPPQQQEDQDRAEAAAAELLGPPAGGYPAQ